MARPVKIRFQSTDMARTVTFDTTNGTYTTLLSLARAHGVPLLFNCESGDCGACLVYVCAGANGTPPPLTEKERFFLAAAGDAATAGIAETVSTKASFRPRLACQCPLGEDDLVVTFASRLA